MPTGFSRTQVLAYRCSAQGLRRESVSTADLAVLDLAVQDSAGSARLAFDARLAEPAPPPSDLTLAWSLRGAPHLHRPSDLATVAAAMWPLSDADAATRLGETGTRLKKSGRPALAAFGEGVELIGRVITQPTGKSAASTAISAQMSEELGRFCRVCKVVHVSELVMRLCSLPAGVELEQETSPPVLLPTGTPLATGPDSAATVVMIDRYLRLLGPAGPAEVAGYLGARRPEIAALWPDQLVEVSVDGTRGWVPEDVVVQLETAVAAEPEVRLLGPFDPWLQARDRELIVPDTTVHKTLWPTLGRPGVILLGTEVVGCWRPRSAKSTLNLQVEEFVPLTKAVREQIASEAERVCTVRGQRFGALIT